MGKSNFGGYSILSAGMFFVPANEKSFPGASIFN
jgi:hypothetical protein